MREEKLVPAAADALGAVVVAAPPSIASVFAPVRALISVARRFITRRRVSSSSSSSSSTTGDCATRVAVLLNVRHARRRVWCGRSDAHDARDDVVAVTGVRGGGRSRARVE
jgi:hypothetical protein